MDQLRLYNLTVMIAFIINTVAFFCFQMIKYKHIIVFETDMMLVLTVVVALTALVTGTLLFGVK